MGKEQDKGFLPAPAKRMRAANDSGPRRASKIRHVVLHSTEGGSAESVARFFATTARASTQLVIDNHETYICVPDLSVPWGAPGFNLSGLHIEHCGYARYTRKDWLAMPWMLDQSARRAALWAFRFEIPAHLLTAGEAAQGKPGFLTHATASIAQRITGGHTDPGTGFPLDNYMILVKQYLARIERAHNV